MKLFAHFSWSLPLLCWLMSSLSEESGDYDFSDLDAPEHAYWDRPLDDPFSRIRNDLESGKIALDSGSEKAFLTSLLRELKIPAGSQTLVFSTTSLQLSLISPRSPRAIYFNEEIYLGYVPGGKIEIISIDPELGGIFYIFDIPEPGRFPQVQRSRRCMNCHSDEDTRDVPGLVIKSVIPGPRGGSLESYRRHRTGHQIPLGDRFGGWYVTGAGALSNHWGNVIGRFTPEGIVTTPVGPGKTFDWSLFPVPTSDILAHLLHEHQAGFVNRTLELHYRARTALKRGGGSFAEEEAADWEERVDSLVRYVLFADEADLPPGGIAGDETFKREFLATRVVAEKGDSLKDLDLETRLFRHRCSYLVYGRLFTGLPSAVKGLVLDRMERALSTAVPDPAFSYLAPGEKESILRILKQTHPDWRERPVR